MFLAGALFTLAASAWTLTHLMGMPEMREGVLTGAEPMGDMMPASLVGAALFQVTWTVMMAAMMLPSLVPFTIGVGRLMRTGGAGRSGTAWLTLGYFAVWVATGAIAYLVWRGFGARQGLAGPGRRRPDRRHVRERAPLYRRW